MQQQQAAVQANSKASLLHQKQQGDMQLEDRKISGRIAAKAVRPPTVPPWNRRSTAPPASPNAPPMSARCKVRHSSQGHHREAPDGGTSE